MNKYPSVESDLRLMRETVESFNIAAMRVIKNLEVMAQVHGHGRIEKIALIQETVARHFQLPVTIMNSPLRTRDFAKARQIAMYLCRELTRYSLQCIADSFSRDHGTVIYACISVTENMVEYPEYANQIAGLRSSLADKLKLMDSTPLVLTA